ncbi:MAG: hypothetical protein V8Q79_05915 [Christensenellales bacterium]
MMTVLLFRMVSMDADRKNRYQTEIAMLSLTRQHQQELSQMYEDLTQRQRDYDTTFKPCRSWSLAAANPPPKPTWERC